MLLKVLLVSLTIFALVLPSPDCLASVEDGRAASAIDGAEEAVTSAYSALFLAEEAGADISYLSFRLNNACNLLVQARFFYDAENFDEAFRLANLCVEISGDVTQEAVVLRDLAVRQAEWNFRLTIALSVFSIALIACIGFFGWRVFKRRYFRRVLGLRPEVVSGEP